MPSLRKESDKTVRALRKEIDNVEYAIERMHGLMPRKGDVVRKCPIHFVLCPLTHPTSSIRNKIARLRAYLKIIYAYHPQISIYIDAESWRIDAIDTAVRLLEECRPTMLVSELRFS